MKTLNEKEITRVTSLNVEDITKDLLIEFFANTKKRNALFNTNDKMTILSSKIKLKSNTKVLNTTVGQYVMNLFLFSNFKIELDYINKPFTGDVVDDINEKLVNYLIEDRIDTAEYSGFIDRVTWISYAMVEYLAPSLSMDIIKPLKSVERRKKELLDEHSEAIETNDPKVVANIEKELINIAKEDLTSTKVAAMDIYNSGSRGSFGNNYKNTSIMRGMIAKPDGSFQFAESNLADGIKEKEVAIHNQLLVNASSARAVGTQEGGALVKELTSAFSTIVAGKEGSNCRTELTMKIKLDENNYKDYLYRNIKTRSGIINLTMDNIEGYIGKVVNLYTPLYCKSDSFCNKCLGNFYYKLGITNIGLTFASIGSRILNSSLKSFHDSTIKTSEFDIEKFIE